jgi:hypothetical protein
LRERHAPEVSRIAVPTNSPLPKLIRQVHRPPRVGRVPVRSEAGVDDARSG